MPILKGNLHAHTTFSDGRLSVEDVVARYRDLGYDFLAITDHDEQIQPDYWMNLPASEQGNWQWRFRAGALTQKISERLRRLTELYWRAEK